MVLGGLALVTMVLCSQAPKSRAQGPPSDARERRLMVQDEACKLDDPNWTRDVWFRLKRHFDQTALLVEGKHGAVLLRFDVGRDGQVLEVVTLRKKGSPKLEVAARDAVLKAAPFSPPRFVDVPCERLGVIIAFNYGMSDKSLSQWFAEGVGESKQ